MDIEAKRNKEKVLVTKMIRLYGKKHDDINTDELIRYALAKIDKCPMMAEKSFCSKCKIHCYQEPYRFQIKKVMRYSGPRMMINHPWLVIKHILRGSK
ncbi:MAG: nitrous oxide-stimulated promoter family protein [Erysipelotrichaceae bacterium]|nr:nitrous oxide-stimulated promoter family protein [Erysipelotrichaceae bacterium]MDY5252945.1 nitrous oxide-stimulated promoter family protein [Erysipelotrichaceae bacterium]